MAPPCRVMFEAMGDRPIWLVGMMGAGKSAVGPLLARSLARRFVDSDVEIERSAGMAVSEIFSAEGEPAFRDRERQLIQDLSGGSDVVALGGGAIAQPRAAALLSERSSEGPTIGEYLESAAACRDEVANIRSKTVTTGASRAGR